MHGQIDRTLPRTLGPIDTPPFTSSKLPFSPRCYGPLRCGGRARNTSSTPWNRCINRRCAGRQAYSALWQAANSSSSLEPPPSMHNGPPICQIRNSPLIRTTGPPLQQYICLQDRTIRQQWLGWARPQQSIVYYPTIKKPLSLTTQFLEAGDILEDSPALGLNLAPLPNSHPSDSTGQTLSAPRYSQPTATGDGPPLHGRIQIRGWPIGSGWAI